MNIFVIVVTYNGMQWYDRCFGSLRTSSIRVKAVVVDNASTDDTVSYIKTNYPEIYLIESSKNLGFGKANNIGLKYALEHDVDYVYLLNQDAWVEFDTIEILIQCHKNNPAYGILSPVHVTASKKKLDPVFAEACSNSQCPGLISDLYFGTLKEVYDIISVMAAHWLISLKCLKTVGGFAHIFPHYGEDNNYLHRVKYHNFKVGIVPIVKAVHDREFRKILPNKDMYLLSISFIVNACNINKNVYFAFFSSTIYLIYYSFVKFIKYRSFLAFKYFFISFFFIPKIILMRKETKKSNGIYLN
jgi:GT2 family glycosyltransferase